MQGLLLLNVHVWLFVLLRLANIAVAQVSFYAIGDVPYSDMEACLLPFELEKLDPTKGQFLIHLGDIRGGKPDPYTGELSECPESLYQHVSELFESSPVPSFFIPGGERFANVHIVWLLSTASLLFACFIPFPCILTIISGYTVDNAWLDCADAEKAYEYWEKHLFYFNDRTNLGWSPFPTNVNRWETWGRPRTTRRSELFSFLLDNVLFIGLSLPGFGRNKDNEWYPRDGLIRDNVEWTDMNFEYYSNVTTAVVIFAHDTLYSGNKAYFDSLSDLLKNSAYKELPVLVLEDAHGFTRQDKFLGLSNVVRIAQDDTVTPMRITVDPYSKGLDNIFRHDRRCICSTNHSPTVLMNEDNRNGRCQAACTEAYEACRGENRCRNDKVVC